MFRNISRAKTAQAVEYVYQDAYAAGDAILQGVAWAELLTEDRYLSLRSKTALTAARITVDIGLFLV